MQTSSGKKGFGLLLALAIALFGARNGAGSIITALNIVYEEKEKRGFIKLNLLALGMTVCAILALIVSVVAIAALGHLDALIAGAPAAALLVGRLLTYALVILAGAAGAAALYRYGPSRPDAKWEWLTPGSLFASLAWGLLTLGFGFYVANFGNYNATYGSLGAVVVLLTWIYLSAYVLLMGAELNAEIERKAAVKTTDEPGEPAIKRGEPAEAENGLGQAATAPAATAPAPVKLPRPSAARQFALQRVGGRIGRLTGGDKIGMMSPLGTALGLSWLRRGRAKAGLGLLAAIAALTWLGGADDEAR